VLLGRKGHEAHLPLITSPALVIRHPVRYSGRGLLSGAIKQKVVIAKMACFARLAMC